MYVLCLPVTGGVSFLLHLAVGASALAGGLLLSIFGSGNKRAD